MTGSLTANGMKSICVPLLQKCFFVSSDLIYHILGTFLKKKVFTLETNVLQMQK